MKIELTDRRLKALKPKAARYELMDITAGLGVMVHPSGKKTWFFRARFGGAKHATRRELSEYPVMSLAEARAKALEWRGMVKAGKDPAAELARQLAAEKAAAELAREGGFANVVEKFIRRRVDKLVAARPVELMLRQQIIPRWGDRRIDEIRRTDVIDLIEAFSDRPGRAHNIFATVRSLFNYARDCGLIEISPADGVRIGKLIGSLEPRQRVLTDAEIRAVWTAADVLGYPYGPMTRLLLVTGQRRSEVSEMRWSEIDLPGKLWTIPADRMKGGVAHSVPLSDLALEILQSVPRRAGSDLVFSVTGGPLRSHAKAKSQVDTASGVQGWTWHDLRRTCRSGLSALCPSDVAELVIAHARPGLRKVYDLHSFEHEKRLALDAWATRLRVINGGSAGGSVIGFKKKTFGDVKKAQ